MERVIWSFKVEDNYVRRNELIDWYILPEGGQLFDIHLDIIVTAFLRDRFFNRIIDYMVGTLSKFIFF